MAEKTTKKNVTLKTRVKIFNNLDCTLSFKDVKKNRVFLHVGGFDYVTVEDLRSLMYESPRMLREGMIYVGDKSVRKYLGLDYSNVIQFRNVKAMLLGETIETLQEKFGDLPKDFKRTVGNIAFEIKDELPLKKAKFVEELSGIAMTDL